MMMTTSVTHDVHWISTTAALPVNGQPVEFMLGARECPIFGVYADDGFRSRWTRYASDLVCKWRGAPALVSAIEMHPAN